MGANRPHTVPSLSAAVNRGNRTTERSMREPFEQDEYPIRERREKCVPSVELCSAWNATDRKIGSIGLSAFYSIAVRDTKGERGAKRDNEGCIPHVPPRLLAAVPVLSADRSDSIPRKRRRGPHSNRSNIERPPPAFGIDGIAHRFQCSALSTIFSVHNYDAVCCVDIRQIFLTRATRHRSLNGNSIDLYLRTFARCSSRVG